MFDRRIDPRDASPVGCDYPLGAVHSVLASLETFADAGRFDVAPQHDFFVSMPPSLAARYAAANSITRRRFDAILREAETVLRTGIGLIMARTGQHDPATIAAARFLGKSIAGSIRRLDNLLTPQRA